MPVFGYGYRRKTREELDPKYEMRQRRRVRKALRKLEVGVIVRSHKGAS